MWAARKALAATSSVLIVVAYVVCIAIAKASETYTGGLLMPYFSDTGRDKPAYFVFSALITSASVLMLGFMALQFAFFKAWFKAVGGAFKCRAVTALVFGLLAPIGSALLSIFDTSSYPDIHAYSAYAFFVCIVFHAMFSLSLYRSLARGADAHKRLIGPRYVVMAVLFVAFVLYIPVGLALASWSELPMADCITLLEDDFCEAHAIPGTNLTDLWDYSGDMAVNTMRSSTQFICIISVMAYIFLHALDPNPPSTAERRDDAGGDKSINLA